MVHTRYIVVVTLGSTPVYVNNLHPAYTLWHIIWVVTQLRTHFVCALNERRVLSGNLRSRIHAAHVASALCTQDSHPDGHSLRNVGIVPIPLQRSSRYGCPRGASGEARPQPSVIVIIAEVGPCRICLQHKKTPYPPKTHTLTILLKQACEKGSMN